MSQFIRRFGIVALFVWAGCAASAGFAEQVPFDLSFATYLGGSGTENSRDIAVDAEGNIYVAGGTKSPDFPATPGAFDTTFDTGGADLGSGGPMDVFVAKLSASGQLLWATYIGGPNYDRAYAIEVGRDGSVTIAGRAGPGFPTTPGTIQPAFAGDLTAGANAAYGKQDGFVARLAPDGSRLLWATYFGGLDSAIIRDVDIDPNGDCYVVSPGNVYASHPHVTTGACDTTHNGGQDAVVAKIRADGVRVIWGTFLGGSGDDGGGPSVRVDPRTGEVVVVGNTSSVDLPVPNGWDRTYGGGNAATGDAFLAKLTPDGSGLVFSTYLGGSGNEGCGTHNLAIGPQGEIVAAHWTMSADVPILPAGFQPVHHGQTDAIVWRFSPWGVLLANTYLGGRGSENVQGIAIHSDGSVYLSIDASTSVDFPVTPTAFQPANAGGADGAFVVLAADLTRVLYATYLGGRGDDGSREAALDRGGNYVCAGDTASADFPLRNAFDSTFSGAGDGFVARFSPSRLTADLNADGIVDLRDLSLMGEQWLGGSDDRAAGPSAVPSR